MDVDNITIKDARRAGIPHTAFLVVFTAVFFIQTYPCELQWSIKDAANQIQCNAKAAAVRTEFVPLSCACVRLWQETSLSQIDSRSQRCASSHCL